MYIYDGMLCAGRAESCQQGIDWEGVFWSNSCYSSGCCEMDWILAGINGDIGGL